jgi:3-hydroxyacyl-CoA dehydrogenase/enoyl-CoA hydratase/3-hydroxybutyryl-CoA epimerase
MSVTEDQVENKSENKDYVVLTHGADGVATITIDVPDTKVNVLSETLMRQLDVILDALKGDSSLKGAIFVSGKKDNFIAGADVVAIKQLQKQSPIQAYEGSKIGKEVFDKIEQLPLNTVAAINGQCLGGGAELALACKYRLAADNKSTKIGFPEVMLGFIPGWGGTVRAPRLIGLQTSLDMIMTGKTLNAKKAWRAGLVDEAVEPEKLIARANEIALGAHPRRHSPDFKSQALRAILESTKIGRSFVQKMAYSAVMKQSKGKYPAPVEALKLIVKNFERNRQASFEAESQVFARLAGTDVSRNLVGLFFAQTESKKTPTKSTGDAIKTVGVLGAGVMGAGIAQVAAFNGYQVVLKDVEKRFVDKGLATIRTLFDELVQKKKLTPEERDKMLAALVTTTDYEKLADCDLVIEAVIEDMTVKQETVKALEAVIKKPFIFASNTSSLSIDGIASAASDPSKVVGIHFFNPVHKMPLVEIVKGKATSDETLSLAKEFAMKLGKTTVTTGDAPGFVVNRVLAPYLREAVILLEEGVPPESIDKAMTSFGFPMGPFTLMDEVGLDIGAKVTHVLHDALGERMAPPALMNKLESLKLLGKKGGKGFFLYDEKGKKRREEKPFPASLYDKKPGAAIFNPDVLNAITAKPNKITPGTIQDRLVLIMLNEATRCLEEGVINDPSQLDLALIMGIGFPPFLGGILRYADSVGLKIVHQKLAFLSTVAGENFVPSRYLLEKVAAETGFYND